MENKDANTTAKESIVAVIIPTYNHAHFLKKAIDSLIAQSLKNWEAIIINNYSTDNTVELVQSYQDKRLKLINFNNNGVIAASRNVGLKATNAPYVAFLDSDDFWYADKLEKCVRLLTDDVCDIVCNSEDLIENDKKVDVWHHGPENKATYRSMLIKGNCFSTSAMMLKRELLNNIGFFREDPQFITAEDYDLWLRLIKSGARVKFLNEVLGGHLKYYGSSSSSATTHLNAVKAVVDDHLMKIKTTWPTFTRRICYGLIYYGAGRQLTHQNNFILSWNYFLKSLKQNPFRIKTYAGILLLIKKQLSSKQPS